MVAASLWALFFTPMYQLGKFFYVPGRLDKVKKTHMYTSSQRIGGSGFDSSVPAAAE